MVTEEKHIVSSALFSVLCILIVLTAGCMRMPFEPIKNKPPDKPVIEINTHYVLPETLLQLRMKGTDPESDKVSYQIMLEKLDEAGSIPEYTYWTSFFPSGEDAVMGLHCSGGLFSLRLRCKDDNQAMSAFSDTIQVYFDSRTPEIVSDDSVLAVNESGTYTIKVTDTSYNETEVRIDPGDGSGITGWLELEDHYNYLSINYNHYYSQAGTYNLKAQTRYYDGTTSCWSEPFVITVIPSLGLVSDFLVNNTITDITCIDNYAYLVTSYQGVCPVNLQNPSQPAQGTNFGNADVRKLASNGDELFLYSNPSYGQFGEYAYSLDDPAHPGLLHNMSNNIYASGVSGNILIMHSSYNVQGSQYLCWIYTYDRATGFTEQASITSTGGYGAQSIISYPYVYILTDNYWSDALYTVDISDLHNPQVVNTQNLYSSYSGYGFNIGDGYLYLCSGNSIDIYSLATPSNPVRVYQKQLDTYTYINKIHFGNGYLAVSYSSSNGKLELFDILPDGTPVSAGYYHLLNNCKGVRCEDDYVYAIADNNHLYTLRYPSTTKQSNHVKHKNSKSHIISFEPIVK